MGLFSFIKEAGEKLFGHEEEKKLETKSIEELNFEKATRLKDRILAMGLPVDKLNIIIVDDKAIVYGEVPNQETREKIILVVGNTEGIGEVDDRLDVMEEEAKEAEPQFYTVQKGDYLSKIAKEVYGDANKYMIIFEANKPMLSDPDKIYPGQVLRIPPLEE
ncbi:MAG: peptidoglycan-binding protein LysM [Chlorobi bacterium]|nr:peptidoglycan-binding protein LysM [Chlorobiota bacterium]